MAESTPVFTTSAIQDWEFTVHSLSSVNQVNEEKYPNKYSKVFVLKFITSSEIIMYV